WHELSLACWNSTLLENRSRHRLADCFNNRLRHLLVLTAPSLRTRVFRSVYNLRQRIELLLSEKAGNHIAGNLAVLLDGLDAERDAAVFWHFALLYWTY